MNLDQHRFEFLKKNFQFVVIDDQFRIVESCNSLFDLSGYYKKSIFEPIPFLEAFTQDILKNENGNEINYPFINLTLLGKQGCFDFSFTRIQDESLLLITDRNDNYEKFQLLQQERNQSVMDREIKEKEARLKSLFLANMSHEIRTPMNVVMGYTELLLASKDLTEESREYAENIQLSSNNLLHIINDILDLSKIEAGALNVEIVTIDLHHLMDNVQKIFHKECVEREIDFRINLEENVPQLIKSDPVRINQILTNLVSNALKFSGNGSEVSIHISVSEAEQSLIFKVIDHGIGIEADKLDQIFENFEQEEASTTRQFGGTGLGLSIVKKLTELLNGSVTVKSKKGQGSTFVINIPLLRGSRNDLENSLEKTKLSKRDVLAGKNFLIAEDNKMNQMLIVKILENTGINLTLAMDGQEAVDHAEANKFDAILMDVQMPQLDGLDATRMIRKSGGLNANTPIIGMTAHSFQEDIKRCYDSGMTGYISKPFDLDNLFAVIINQVEPTNSEELNRAASVDDGQPVPATENEIVLDFGLLEQLSGGDEAFFNEFLQTYVKEMRMVDEKMSHLTTGEDIEAVKQLIHKIIPTLDMVGLSDVKNQINDFERGEVNSETSSELIKKLQPIIQSSLRVIKKILN